MSVLFPAEAGGKFAQEYQSGSKEWREMYGHGRNSVESFNAYLKGGGTHALEGGSRRRLRGSVAQYSLATMTVVAADKIIDFAAQKTEDGDDKRGRHRGTAREAAQAASQLANSASDPSARPSAT